jgi:hypothetical protein
MVEVSWSRLWDSLSGDAVAGEFDDTGERGGVGRGEVSRCTSCGALGVSQAARDSESFFESPVLRLTSTSSAVPPVNSAVMPHSHGIPSF